MAHRRDVKVELIEDHWKIHPYAHCVGNLGVEGCLWLAGMRSHMEIKMVEASAKDHALQNPGHVVILQWVHNSVFVGRVQE